MVKPSSPRFMLRVLEAVTNLGNTKGSSSREVLDFIRQSNVSTKNLTMQVHRALKHAVNAGLLRHRNGRYKVLEIWTPTYDSAPPAKEPINNDKRAERKKSKCDVSTHDRESSRRTHEPKMKTGSRRRSSKRRRTNAKKRSSRSPYARLSNATVQKRKQRKRTHEDEELENRSSEGSGVHRENKSSIRSNRTTKRSKVSKRELKSDLSDESDRDSVVSRKHVSRANKTPHREMKRKIIRAKSKGRSASRNRSLQLQQDIENDREQCNEDYESTEHSITHQKSHEDLERIREPDESNSGSTLDNS